MLLIFFNHHEYDVTFIYLDYLLIKSSYFIH